MSTTAANKPGLILILGALLGACLAASGILEAPKPELGKELVARVNGEYIGKSDYLDYLELLARDKRNPMSTQDRRQGWTALSKKSCSLGEVWKSVCPIPTRKYVRLLSMP